ncbi:MAG: chain length determinant protein tyrosine kinase EpsG [Sulfuritalea sp.]|nr:chain length determinant protein tyrosine kinase EpsG [Sulfuritalea sp.]
MNVVSEANLHLRDRSIGAILVDGGRLSLGDAERILRLQKETGLRFGEAAINLGLLSEQDIQQALACQFDYPYLIKREHENEISAELVAAYEPFGRHVESLRGLRSQLLLRWFTGESERKTLAVVSPGRGEGRSYLAANLAVVFSQLGEHTLLIDADIRNPRQHALFHLDNRVGLTTILSGRATIDAIRRIPSFMDLSVLAAGPQPPNPQELLLRPLFAKLLEELAHEFDVIILDTPAGDASADAQTIAIRASGAVVLARNNLTSVPACRRLVKSLVDAGVVVVGSVFNDPPRSAKLSR